MTGKYDDIIHLSRPASPNRARMSQLDRAAQFSPFAALTGYEEAIEETGRLTDPRRELGEARYADLNRALHEVLEVLKTGPMVRMVRFLPDGTKTGGQYVSCQYRIRKIDLHHRIILTTEGETIPLDDLWELELL